MHIYTKIILQKKLKTNINISTGFNNKKYINSKFTLKHLNDITLFKIVSFNIKTDVFKYKAKTIYKLDYNDFQNLKIIDYVQIVIL